MAGKIYVVNHYALLHFYIEGFKLWPSLFQKILKTFPHYYKSREANGAQRVENLDPRGMVGKIYVRDHQTLLHIWAS